MFFLNINSLLVIVAKVPVNIPSVEQMRSTMKLVIMLKIDPAITDNNFYSFHISSHKLTLLEIVINISERSQLL